MKTKERLEWLEPWQVSLGGEHYLFPAPHYFMNINIKQSDIAVWPILTCFTLHTLLFGLSEGNLRARRDLPEAWGENLFRTGKSSDISYFPKLGSKADLDFLKITLALLTPAINVLSATTHLTLNCKNSDWEFLMVVGKLQQSAVSAMHADISPQVSSVFATLPVRVDRLTWEEEGGSEVMKQNQQHGVLPLRLCQCSSLT